MLRDRYGYEIFAASHKISPKAPVILMTGFGYDPHHSIVRASQEGLQAVVSYLQKKAIPNDPWGRPFQYVQPGRNAAYDIISYGADGREGGEGKDADIGNWDGS